MIAKIINKKSLLQRLSLTLLALLITSASYSQTKRVTFDGVGRSVMFYDNLGGEITKLDTTNADKSFNGYTLLDLEVDVKPNKSTHIEACIRLRNDFGGFYGAGVTVDIRKLLVEGVIKDKLKYQFGDVNFKLTPYTFNYHKEELSVNEPTIFRDFKEILYYENLILDTSWRQQGIVLDFGLQADKGFKEMDFKAFITRTRSASISSFPERFFSGLNWHMIQSDYFELGITITDMFDLAKTSRSDAQMNNLVSTLNTKLKYDIGKTTLGIEGETGISRISYKNIDNSPAKQVDYFYDFGIFTKTDFGLSAKLSYQNVGPQFISAGSQTKRINWDNTPVVFNEVTNAVVPREPSLLDIYYDETLYNVQIQNNLGTYLPNYGNALPYGKATPNRSGFTLGLNYLVKDRNWLEIGGELNYLSEIVGSGSSELKKFWLINGHANFYMNKLLNLEKKILLSIGAQLENTKRSGTEFSEIQLSSKLLETGVEVEIFKNFDLLFGMKWFMASGNEFVEVRNEFNEISNFQRFFVDERDVLMAGGMKYRFNDNIYLTAQYINSNWFDFLNSPNSYSVSRFMILYNMEF